MDREERFGEGEERILLEREERVERGISREERMNRQRIVLLARRGLERLEMMERFREIEESG